MKKIPSLDAIMLKSSLYLKSLTLAAMLLGVGSSAKATLVGHWLNGGANLTDASGFTTAGTHDGVAVGPNAGLLAYSSDVPIGFTGQSLSLVGNVLLVLQTAHQPMAEPIRIRLMVELAARARSHFGPKGFRGGGHLGWVSVGKVALAGRCAGWREIPLQASRCAG